MTRAISLDDLTKLAMSQRAAGTNSQNSASNSIFESYNNNGLVINGGAGDDIIIVIDEDGMPVPIERPIVAANRTAYAWGDPHLEWGEQGKDQKKAEFQPEGIYNMLTDKNLKIRSELVKYNNGDVTVIDRTALTIGTDKVLVEKDGKITINGNVVELKDGEEKKLADGSTLKKDGKNVSIKTKEYNIELTNDGSCQNLRVNSGENGVDADGKKPTGVLGDTFTDGAAAPLESMDTDKDGKIETDESKRYKEDSLFDEPKKKTGSGTSQKDPMLQIFMMMLQIMEMMLQLLMNQQEDELRRQEDAQAVEDKRNAQQLLDNKVKEQKRIKIAIDGDKISVEKNSDNEESVEDKKVVIKG